MATNPDLTDGANQGLGGPVVTDLVTRARNGDKQAWDALVERYAPLIWSICRRHGLGDADAEDVGQNVWLKLVDQLERSGSRPRCPAGWPPRPAGNAAASCACRREHAIPGRYPTPRPSRTMTPGQPRTNCSRPNAVRPCARRSRTCSPAASS